MRMTAKDALFIGVYPTGLVYADRRREEHGDYKRCAYLNYRTLELDIEKDCAPDLLDAIKANATEMQAKRGQPFALSTCGQMSIDKGSFDGQVVMLGG